MIFILIRIINNNDKSYIQTFDSFETNLLF